MLIQRYIFIIVCTWMNEGRSNPPKRLSGQIEGNVKADPMDQGEKRIDGRLKGERVRKASKCEKHILSMEKL